MQKTAYKLLIKNHVSEKYKKKDLNYIREHERTSLSRAEAAYIDGIIILPFAKSVEEMSHLEIRTPKKTSIDYTQKFLDEETRTFMKKLQESLNIKQQEMKKIVNTASKLLKDIKDDKDLMERQLEILEETTQNVINKKQVADYIKQIHQNCDKLIKCLFLKKPEMLGDDHKEEVLQKIEVLETYLHDLKKQLEPNS
ncbi:hypothetical protein [Peribacillus sp. SI8-4]|uniref:hypothetical protein n=1 Tax=Peribacillus sp. SI8-4 TaxID=3048009 RepID=UPI002552AC1B|nr:hypothetical protein [Peribacillus sp. SI8-4]